MAQEVVFEPKLGDALQRPCGFGKSTTARGLVAIQGVPNTAPTATV